MIRSNDRDASGEPLASGGKSHVSESAGDSAGQWLAVARCFSIAA